MSRLDSFIRRLTAQRACLDHAVGRLNGRNGPVLELGLGNGRTYDHLREALGSDRIYVMDRRVAAHPGCIPPSSHMIIGEFQDTLPQVVDRFQQTIVLAHLDIGSGDKQESIKLAASISGAIVKLMAPGGVVLSDQPLVGDAFDILPLPDGVQEGRYFMYLAV